MGTAAVQPVQPVHAFEHGTPQPLGTHGFHLLLPVQVEAMIFQFFGLGDVLFRVARLSRYFAWRVKNLKAPLRSTQNNWDDEGDRVLAYRSLGICFPTY